MLVYKFDEKGLFVGIDETELDPLESKLQGKEIFLLPPNATFDAPEIKEGFAPVWNGGKWEQIEDHRGVAFWLEGDSFGTLARTMNELGPLPKGATLVAPVMTEEEKQAQALLQAKAERADAVSKIIVDVDGMAFDGDEESQTRMGRTIAAAIALGVDIQTYTQVWVLANNTVAQVTIAQLARALKLAGETQTALWTVPYKA